MAADSSLRSIPAWLRAPAGLIAAAALVAIFLLIRDAPDRAGDGAAVLRLVALAILFLAVAVLFAYVAATGLPPSHLWRHAGHRLWPEQADLAVTPAIHRFLLLLRGRHPGVRECWILESTGAGEWRFLLRADGAVNDALRGDWDIRRKDVQLFLVEELAQTVAPAWGRSVPVIFASWDWEPQADSLAEFRCPVSGAVCVAQRLWPLLNDAILPAPRS